MTYPVVTFPNPILCGKCGQAVRQDDYHRLGKPVIVRCWNNRCEQHDIPLVFPEVVLELEGAKDASP